MKIDNLVKKKKKMEKIKKFFSLKYDLNLDIHITILHGKQIIFFSVEEAELFVMKNDLLIKRYEFYEIERLLKIITPFQIDVVFYNA